MPLKDREARRLYMIEWRKRNLGKANEHARNTYARNAEEYATKKREWRAANPEASKRSNHKNYWSHVEVRREKMRNYAREHPEQFLEYSSQRRAMKRGATIERVYRRIVFDRDHGVCGLCGNFVDPERWALDHVMPLIRGGEHCYDNVIVSHPLCNLKKGSKTLVEYLPEIVEMVAA